MKINTKEHVLKKLIKIIDTNDKIDEFSKEGFLLSIITYNDITEEVIDYYKLYKYNNFFLIYNPYFQIEWIKKYNIENADYSQLSFHKNFNIDWVKKYPNGNWLKSAICYNSKFDIDWVKKVPLSWDFYHISYNSNFNIKWLDQYPNEKWNFDALSKNSNFDITWYEKYPNKEWDFTKIPSYTNKIALKFENEYSECYPNKPMKYEEILNYDKKLIYKSNFVIEWVDKYPNKDWNFKLIGYNPNFSIKWIDKYPKKNWDFLLLSGNTKFDIEWYSKHPNDEWDFKTISKSSNFKLEWMKKYPYRDWDFEYIFSKNNIDKIKNNEHINFLYNLYKKDCDINLFKNYDFEKFKKFIPYISNLTLKSIKENPKLRKCFKEISKNKNFYYNWINHYPDGDWDYRYLFNNNIITNIHFKELDPEFDIEWIEQNKDYNWNFKILSLNQNFNPMWFDLYQDKDWDIVSLCENENIDLETIKLYCDIHSYYDKLPQLNVKKLKNFDISWINIFDNQKWNFFDITLSPNFNIEWVKKCSTEKWDFEYILNKLKIDKFELLKIIKKNYHFFRTVNIDEKFIQIIINNKNDFDYSHTLQNLCCNKSFKFEFIEKYPNENWLLYSIIDNYTNN